MIYIILLILAIFLNAIMDSVKRNTAIFKFNSGLGALLCSKCNTIIKVGSEFNDDEILAMKGEKKLKSQYCPICIKLKNVKVHTK